MGALTSFTKWNPEDDLLLKNAVEAGASLESLAKGAVHFSCRFTVRELEERWRSLLYDVNTSTEASARILEIEIGVSANVPSKPGRTCNSKVKDASSGRRKGESLRCYYHATRKRARSDSHNPANLGFLVPPSTNAAIGNNSSPHDPFEMQNELSLSRFPLDVQFSDNYGHPETGYGSGQHVYPEIVEVESTAPSNSVAFHRGMVVELPVGISSNDCLYGHPENMSPLPIKEVGYHDACENFEHNFIQKVLPHALDRNHCSPQTSDVTKSTSAFHHHGYSSPPSGLIWRTTEDVSTPTLQMDGQFVEKAQGVLTMSCIKEVDNHACDDFPKGKINGDPSTAALDNSTNLVEPNFIDFSSTCISFTDDEDILLIDVDEEDIGDRSCLNGLGSMFLSSPADTNIDNLPISDEPITLEVFDIPASNIEASAEHEAIHEDIHNDINDPNSSVVPEVSILSSSPSALHIEDLPNCILNTEDQDIPCNDDVIFPVKLFQAYPANLRQDVSTTLANDEKVISGDSTLAEERKTSVQPNVPNFKSGLPLLPKAGLLHSAADCILESVSSGRNLISGISRVSNKDMDDPNSIPSAITQHYSQDLALEQETRTEDLNMQVACMTSHTELVSSELGCVDPLPTMSISDQEDQTFENEDDDDVPSFSDVEAMILDMDLGPYDQESCLFTKEVSRYQSIDMKKAIIRLEQGARSYMNRAISSHGAFAIFYGRHLKYFIRNPEVLIGRDTEDKRVDIDLAKEGRANKISRRQAIIKMDEDGYFLLKNIGKNSIFVNSKEVPAKKRVNLSSCALIEIRDMRFIFDVNEVAVRRYFTSSQPMSHGRKSEYDFVCS